MKTIKACCNGQNTLYSFSSENKSGETTFGAKKCDKSCVNDLNMIS